MKFRNNLPSAEEVKNTNLVDYLSSLAFKPSRVSRSDYWYISPFRDERTASFKVNRSPNRWHDFGDGESGNLIDFGVLFYRRSVADFLKKIRSSFSFQQLKGQPLNEEDDSKKIKIINEKRMASLMLSRYLHKRRIPVDLTLKYCRQIDYDLYGKAYYVIALKTMPVVMYYAKKNLKRAAHQKMLL